MKTQNLLFSAGVALSTVLAVSTSAKAASFTTTFTPNPANPSNDIFLQSVTQNGATSLIPNGFILVNRTVINSNTPITFNLANSGAASTDRGDNASNGNGGTLPTSPASPTAGETTNPTGADITAYLGNLNLNNIVDTEDTRTSAFNLDVFFEAPVAQNLGGRDSFFFWERGANSDIQVQGLDDSGALVGNPFTITRSLFASSPAGYSINTREIATAQAVGSYGVSFANLGVNSGTLSGLRLISNAGFNGPDFKVVAAVPFGGPTVPEPTTMLGLGSVAALALLRRRQTKKGFSLKSSV